MNVQSCGAGNLLIPLLFTSTDMFFTLFTLIYVCLGEQVTICQKCVNVQCHSQPSSKCQMARSTARRLGDVEHPEDHRRITERSCGNPSHLGNLGQEITRVGND